MNKAVIYLSKMLSIIFSPFLSTFWAFLFVWHHMFAQAQTLDISYKVFLFNNSYQLTTTYRNYLLAIVLIFTVIIPYASIYFFRRLNKWSGWQISHREHRHVPYIIAILSYAACLLLLTQTHTWMFFRSIVLASLACMILSFAINFRWKISTHMVGMGGLTGMLIACSITLRFNPLFPLSILFLLAGSVGTARMTLRQHSLAQIGAGFLLGVIVTALIISFRGVLCPNFN